MNVISSFTQRGTFPRLFATTAGVALAVMGLAPVPANAVMLDRLSGSDRVATAIKVLESKQWGDTVFLGRADNYADLVSATPLTKALNAPVIPTGKSALDPRVGAAIAQHGFKKVVLLGGTGALSAQVASDVASLGVELDRISGADRFDTAANLAQRAVHALQKDKVPFFIATGSNYPDALAAGAAAAHVGGVVVLAGDASIDPQSQSIMAVHASSIYAVGGPAVKAVANTSINAIPIKGVDRYDTAAQLAKNFYSSPSRVTMATGENYADAVFAGTLAATTGTPLLLTPSGTTSASTAQYLKANTNTLQGGGITLVGGDKAINPMVAHTMHQQAQGIEAEPGPQGEPSAYLYNGPIVKGARNHEIVKEGFDIVLKLKNDAFKAPLALDEAVDWVSPKVDGLNYTVKWQITPGDTVAYLRISGIPSHPSNAPFSLTVPGSMLYSGKTLTATGTAQYAIVDSANLTMTGHAVGQVGQPFPEDQTIQLTLDKGTYRYLKPWDNIDHWFTSPRPAGLSAYVTAISPDQKTVTIRFKGVAWEPLSLSLEAHVPGKNNTNDSGALLIPGAAPATLTVQ